MTHRIYVRILSALVMVLVLGFPTPNRHAVRAAETAAEDATAETETSDGAKEDDSDKDEAKKSTESDADKTRKADA
jgi:hypothetical protein